MMSSLITHKIILDYALVLMFRQASLWRACVTLPSVPLTLAQDFVQDKRHQPGSPARAEAAGSETPIAEPGLAMDLAAPAAPKRRSGGETPPAAWQRTSHARLDVDPEPRGAPRLAADEVEEELRAITKRVRHDDVISGLVVEEYLVCGGAGQTFDDAFNQAADLADQVTSDDLWECL